MSNVRFTDLPTVANATLADITCAVQSNVSSQQTWNQILTLMQNNIIQNYPGNPNGNVAGVIYALCWDTVNHVMYICTATGSTVTAVWTLPNNGIVPMANGGTSANLTPSNGGIIYSGASSMAVLAGTPTANQLLMSGSNGAPSWSANTFPSASPVNAMLYASSADTFSNLASVQNAVLTTNTSGVPTWMTTSGTYTPTATFFVPGDLSVSYVSQDGNYFRLGNLIIVRIVIRFTPTYTTAASGLFISLPFTVSGSGNFGGSVFSTNAITYPAGATYLVPQPAPGSARFQIVAMGSGTTFASLSTSNIPSGVQQHLDCMVIYSV